MGSLTIVQKNTPCDEAIDWPVFYMNDFTVMGLLVESLARSLDVLEQKGFRIDRGKCIARVNFNTNRRFREIFEALRHHNIEHSMSDLASCAYQG